MADSSSEDTTSSGSDSENEFDRHKKNELIKSKMKSRNIRHRQRSESSSSESSAPRHKPPKKEQKVIKKQHKKMEESDDSSSSSTSTSTDDQVKKKKKAAPVKKKSYHNEEDTHKRSYEREPSYKKENESANQLKDRHIKREVDDRNSYCDRRQHRHQDYDERQQRNYDNRHDYNGNEKYIKNEDGSRHKYKEEKHIKSEDYNTYNNTRDHRKRQNEYRHHSPDNKYDGKYRRRTYEDEHGRDDEREHGSHHKREEYRNRRRHSDGDHGRHKPNLKIKAERDWDKGKNEYGSPTNDEHVHGFHNNDQSESTSDKPTKEEANYNLSGKLTEFTNTYNGVVILYNEPPEARKPKTKWRFYPFKGEKALTMLQLHRQSAFLLGRDRKVADIPVDHPSCSKQHAVLQFRLVEFERPDGAMGKRVKPYIIDLDSRNGTHVNNQRIEGRKYVELLGKDVIKFGFSSRDYVLLHEKSEDVKSSQDEGADDDDVKQSKKK